MKDGAYHELYDVLFRTASEEKRLYRNGKTDAARSKAERALAHCSEALRATIRSGAEKLKPKTVRYVIQNVIQFVSLANGDFDSPYSHGYLKTLSTLLEHEPHIELLDESDWLAAVEYCIHGITHQATDSAALTSLPHPAATTRVRPSPRSLSSLNSPLNVKKRNAEELMECLHALVSATNAPVLQTPESIANAIVDFLQSQGPVIGHFHHVGFSALNAMIQATYAEEVSISTSIIPRVLPMIAQLWSSKTASNDEMLNVSKDEMAITIIIWRLHMKRLMAENDGAKLEPFLIDVQQSLMNDYEKRSERDQLQIDDVIMDGDTGCDTEYGLLPAGFFFVQPHNLRTERKWAILRALAVVDGLLHDNVSNNADTEGDDSHDLTHPRKRRRIQKRYDSLLDEIRTGSNGRRLLALQIMLFSLSDAIVEKDDVRDILKILSPLILDREANVSNWAMVCTSGYAFSM